MRTLEFTKSTVLGHIIESIKKVPEEDLELIIPSDSPVRQNPINLKIIEKVSSDLGKRITIKETNMEGDSSPVFTQVEQEENLEEDDGFVEGVDIHQEDKQTSSEPLPIIVNRKKFTVPDFNIQKIVGLKEYLPKISIPKFSVPKRFLIPSIGLSLFLILLLLSYINLPSAQIVLYVEPKSVERAVQLDASTSVNDTSQGGVVPLKEVNSDQEGKLTASATGKKTIGEAAKGMIEIRNYANSQKVFDNGVKVKIQDGVKLGLEFTLDRAATVPTATTSRNNPSGREITDPGRAEVNVTAVKIGDESNILSGTLFSIASLSSTVVTAIATKDFSGGLSKEVTVVSSEDQRKAEESLTKQLTEKSEQEVKGKLASDLRLPEGGIINVVVRKVFDKDIDREVKEFSLTMQIKSVARVYSEKDLKRVMINSITNILPEGYTLDEEKSTIEAEVIKGSGKEVRFLGKISGSLIPNIDRSALVVELKGKSYSKAEEILKGLTNVHGYEIKASPTFPVPLSYLPFRASKIKVEITSR